MINKGPLATPAEDKEFIKEIRKSGDLDYPEFIVLKRGFFERINMILAPSYFGEPKGNNPHSASYSESGIEAVGPTKPLGYYPIPEELNKHERNQLIAKYKAKGLNTYLIDESGGHKRGYFLYVYDKESLNKLLSKRRNILEEAYWPTKAGDFVRMLAVFTVRPKTKLFTVIAEAFADRYNPGRIDII